MKVYIHPSKSGLEHYVVLTQEGAEFFAKQCEGGAGRSV